MIVRTNENNPPKVLKAKTLKVVKLTNFDAAVDSSTHQLRDTSTVQTLPAASATENMPSLILYREDGNGFIKLTDAYPEAKFYPEIVNGFTDVRSYQDYLSEVRGPFQLDSKPYICRT